MQLRRVLTLLALTVTMAHAEPLTLTGDWWQAPAAATRHTTLVCSFDSGDDADFARDFTGSGGFGIKAEPQGSHGAGIQLTDPGGHLDFRGGSNVQLAHGTVRFAVKGDVWQADGPRWLFDARGADRIGVMREPGKLSLVVCPATRTDQFISRLDLPLGQVSTDAWHTVVASWDRAAGRGWVALDGEGVSGELTGSTDPRAAFAIFLGSAGSSRPGGLNFPPLAFDDFVLYDQPLPLLEATPEPLPEEDAAYVPEVEDGIRQTLGLLADLQRWGGWQTLYTWPTLLGSAAQGRDFIDFDDYLDNDKGNGSCPVASRFLWAYEAIGDYQWLEVGLRTGEFLLAAQAPEGYWVHGYRMTVHGIRPVAGPSSIKFQDQDQSHPMLLLTYLHRLTGDQRYLDAAKRAGEFYLTAQNPNGSWPHHYDLPNQRGENATGIPGGGELNDRATNDAVDMMALMYHLTKEPKYIQAMRRLGDWLLAAQGRRVPLWSDQYDGDNNPAWARAFEPPSYGATATTLACQALREIYRFSGDQRYLTGLQKAHDWIDANLPEGQMPCFVDPESGRAIAAWDRQIYFLDDPKSIAFLKTVPVGSGYTKKTNVGGTVARLLQQAQGAKPQPVAMDPATARDALGGKRNAARSAMDSRHEAGVWTVPIVADYMGSIGEGFAAVSPRVTMMIGYVETARIATGELPARYPGSADLRLLAYPEPDWYEVDWESGPQG